MFQACEMDVGTCSFSVAHVTFIFPVGSQAFVACLPGINSVKCSALNWWIEKPGRKLVGVWLGVPRLLVVDITGGPARSDGFADRNKRDGACHWGDTFGAAS